MLSDALRQKLYVVCKDHEVARCPQCGRVHHAADLGVDLFARERRLLCGDCRTDLTALVLAHLAHCPGATGAHGA